MDYQQEINKKEKFVRETFKKIIGVVANIFKDIEESDSEYKNIIETICYILLPLQYLVKHAAFHEEQECRMMYITNLQDDKIICGYKNKWMYVEYSEPMPNHLDKIYLSPGAADYQDFFRVLIDKSGQETKVRLSSNPFRCINQLLRTGLCQSPAH